MKKPWLYTLLLMMTGSATMLGEDFRRIELQPFGGFTASGSIPLKSDDNVSHGSIHINSSYNAGAAFTIFLNPLDAVEAFWQRQSTGGRLPAAVLTPLSPGDSPAFNLKIDQLHLNFLHHYKIADPKSMPYVLGGLGVTTYRAGGGSGSKSYFSFSLGGGMKYLLTSHFGFRGEVRWSPALLSASDSSFWCEIGGSGASCVIKLKASFQHQVDMTGGIIFRF